MWWWWGGGTLEITMSLPPTQFSASSSTRGNPPARLALEVTYGINFMLALTVRAVRKATAYASLARVLMNKNLGKIEAFNSDLYLPGIEDPCWRSLENSCQPGEECAYTRLSIHRFSKKRLAVSNCL